MSQAIGTVRPSSADSSGAQTAGSASRADAERAARRLSQPAAAAGCETGSVSPLLRPKPTVAPEQGHWFVRMRRRLLGDEGAAYGVSLLVHVVILAIFAVPVIRHVTRDEPLIAAVVEQSAGGGSPFGLPDMINTELSPVQPLTSTPSQLAVPDLAANETLAISKAVFGTPQGEGGEGTGAGSGVGAGEVGNGMLQFVPKNAVRAGSFAAWTTPVYNDRFPRPFGAPEPKPGDSPQPMQNYWITIQIKVPGDRKRFPVRDLTGEVVGTDGYRQRIPDHTYQLTNEGKLVPLGRKKDVPVFDGLVQFVVQVPGARDLVKDTIVIKSKLLGEEQAMELVFQGADERDVTEEL